MTLAQSGACVIHSLPSAGEDPSTKSITIPALTDLLVVIAGNTRYTPPRTIDSLIFDGTEALTAIDSQDSGDAFTRIEAWYRLNPTIKTANLVNEWSGAARGGFAIFFFSGAAASAPVSAKGTGTGALSIASVAGGIVLGSMYVDDGDGTTLALTAGTSEANFIGSPGAGGSSGRLAVASQAGTGSPVSTTWTPTGSALSPVRFALAIAPASAGSTQPPRTYHQHRLRRR